MIDCILFRIRVGTFRFKHSSIIKKKLKGIKKFNCNYIETKVRKNATNIILLMLLYVMTVEIIISTNLTRCKSRNDATSSIPDCDNTGIYRDFMLGTSKYGIYMGCTRINRGKLLLCT